MVQSTLAKLEFKFTGVAALKRNPPVMIPSPIVLSFEGYLAAAAASVEMAIGFV
jgi:hypothetical protein